MSRVTDNMGRNNFPPDDNPFGIVSTNVSASTPKINFCGIVVGLAQDDIPTFLSFEREASKMWPFYLRRDYKGGAMLAYDMSEWDKDNPAIKRMMNFLHLLADTHKPVAFIRWGDDFEAWANEEGYRIFRNRISFGSDLSGLPAIVFAPDDPEDELF